MVRGYLKLVAEGNILIVFTVITGLLSGCHGRLGGGSGAWGGVGCGGRCVGRLVRGSGGGGDDGGGDGRAATGCGRDLNGLRSAENLANVDVVARFVNLRVVQVQDGAVDTSGSANSLAGVVGLDNVGGAAILVFVSEADLVAWGQVAASRVDDTIIDNCELVSRHMLSRRDTVADFILPDGVCPNARASEGRLSQERNGENCSGDGLVEHVDLVK